MRLIDADALMEFITGKAETEVDAVIASVCRGAALSMPTIDPIRAAGGCRCGECKYRESIEGSNDYCALHETFCSKFCGDGKAREAQDDG